MSKPLFIIVFYSILNLCIHAHMYACRLVHTCIYNLSTEDNTYTHLMMWVVAHENLHCSSLRCHRTLQHVYCGGLTCPIRRTVVPITACLLGHMNLIALWDQVTSHAIPRWHNSTLWDTFEKNNQIGRGICVGVSHRIGTRSVGKTQTMCHPLMAVWFTHKSLACGFAAH